ncbi:unnamed protein product [Brassicogethes aeneus]|uniref:C3H1-type domain-containing protein n=1 Tax=Brassicogethes aeneus TaxID=1431903 RepID=A0A9P0FCV7_BRAAE|nr:unnamed protein product [Brassicogethes aeneus]
MALVCDTSNNGPSEDASPAAEPPPALAGGEEEGEDLEDGEIEDDDDEVPVDVAPQILEAPPPQIPNLLASPVLKSPPDRDRRKHEEKLGKKHMTEAEKSILHLRKREKMQREKWEKYKREVPNAADTMDDDFAKNIEKTLATILSKKEKEAQLGESNEDKEEKEVEVVPKRGRKRKKQNKKQKQNKQRRTESPKMEEFDENEMLNVRGGSPLRNEERRDRSLTPNMDDSMSSQDYSSDKSEEKSRKRDRKNNRKNRDRNKHRDRERNNRTEPQMSDSQGVCVYYLQGKCQKTNCPFSHEASPPMKLELCKFYLMGCCAKGEKCSYMHHNFPCKFYHTGLNCTQGENCKFAHGKPLSDELKQILFKHIETAPRDILGGFPRMSREEALTKINVTQINLQNEYGITPSDVGAVGGGGGGGIPSLFDIDVPVPPELQGDDPMGGGGQSGGGKEKEKERRNRRSRWQDSDGNNPKKPFDFGHDQDMRINSNGDVDMRTLAVAPPLAKKQDFIDLEQYKREATANMDVDIRSSMLRGFQGNSDVDIRSMATKDVDIRQMAFFGGVGKQEKGEEGEAGEDFTKDIDINPPEMPKAQRELFLRIQAQQSKNVRSVAKEETLEREDDNINWYSDDESDDENRLTIKDDNEDVKEKEEAKSDLTSIKPQDVVEKLGDLSKIDISAEVTKLLTSMSQAKQVAAVTAPAAAPAEKKEPAPRRDPRSQPNEPSEPKADNPKVAANDPRTASSDPRVATNDPRQRSSRQSSTENQKSEKISIYEQGSINVSDNEIKSPDVDRMSRSDVDLRNMPLPFKAMENYTPATEIDASVNSHPVIIWKVGIVEIPRPDYTGLKLSVNEAEKSGDPRLRKIFRLSIEEKDSPMSPTRQESTKQARIDPRLLRKQEENKAVVNNDQQMNFNQQLNMLQNSNFYQSLTSNQKLLLNQELASRNDQNMHDPVLNSMLGNLNIIPNANLQANPSVRVALGILASISKIANPMMGPQPGLLGAAPGVPNMSHEFPINFDPRNGGLLGNAPQQFPSNFPPNFPPPDDFYPPQDNGGYMEGPPPRHCNPNPSNRGFNRDRRRGRSNFNRNARNFRQNRQNRANRSHTPP